MRAPWLDAAIARCTLPRILLLALVLRVMWVLLCPNEPVSDQEVYDFSAQVLAAGKGYVDESGNPANYWPVGYAAILAPFYAAFGAKLLGAFVCNVILLLIAVLGLHALGRDLFGERAARVAALAFAVHPTFVLHATILASEVAFCAGLPWAVLCFRRMARTPRALAYGLAGGALVAALTYVRPPALLLLALPLAFGRIERLSVPWTVALTASVVGMTAILLLPWGLRNLHHFGVFSITSFNGGANFWMGNHAGSNGSYATLPPEVDRLSLYDRDQTLRRMAVAFVISHPGEYLLLCARRAVTSLATDTIGAVWNAVGITRRFGASAVTAFKAVCSLAHWALLGAVVLTVVQRARRRALERGDAEVFFVILLLSVPFVFMVGGNRYMVPIVPMLCIWLGSALRDEGSPGAARG